MSGAVCVPSWCCQPSGGPLLSFSRVVSICYASFRFFSGFLSKIHRGGKTRSHRNGKFSCAFFEQYTKICIYIPSSSDEYFIFPTWYEHTIKWYGVHRPFSAVSEVCIFIWFFDNLVSFSFGFASRSMFVSICRTRPCAWVSNCKMFPVFFFYVEDGTTGIRLELPELTINRANSEHGGFSRWLAEWAKQSRAA